MENYFNYFTEIEEYFWKRRGTAMLVSTLDWALIDTWKEARIPIEAVLKGIDRAFEKYDSRRHRARRINSLAYCQQEVLAAAGEQDRAALPHPSSAEPFQAGEINGFLQKNAAALEDAANVFESAGRSESATTLRGLAESLLRLVAGIGPEAPNLQDMELHLTVLEDKLFSTLLQAAAEDDLLSIRGEMEQALGPARSKMTADQIGSLERQFLHRKLMERAKLPRLSLFYL